MAVLAESDTYVIYAEKLGEGAYGAVYPGVYKSDNKVSLAFKFLKETNRHTGLMSSTNCRELLFLSLVTELYDNRSSPYIPLLSVLPSCTLSFQQTVSEQLRNCTVLVMPNYTSDFQGVIFSQAMRQFTPVDALFLFKKLLHVVALMHQQGYAHRDLKHGNVLVDQNWKFRLIDFGMVQYLKEQETEEIATHDMSDTETAHDAIPQVVCEGNNYGKETANDAADNGNADANNSSTKATEAQDTSATENQAMAITTQTAAYNKKNADVADNPKDLNQSGAMATIWWRAPEQCFNAQKIGLYYKHYRRDGRYNDAFAVGLMCIESILGLMLLKQQSSDEKTALSQLLATQFWMDNQINTEEFLYQVEKKLDWEGQQQFIETLARLNNGQPSEQLRHCRSGIKISLTKLIYKTLLVRFAVRGGQYVENYPYLLLLQELSKQLGGLISIEVRNRVLVEPVYGKLCELVNQFSPDHFDGLCKQFSILAKTRKDPGRFQENLRSLGFDSKGKYFSVFKAVYDLNQNWLNELVATFPQ